MNTISGFDDIRTIVLFQTKLGDQMAKQTQSFNAEIKQLLDIVIHSLYSHKEIFLRELISNASDAIDKLKFESLTNSSLLPANHEFEIRLTPDSKTNTLKITDTGIGMSPEDVTSFIGTIAKSGTKAFSQLKSQDLKNRPDLIGQFGVGFYSAFMVADKVTLHTQKAGSSVGTLWESVGDGSYTIDEVPRPEGIGTTIILHLKTNDESSKTEEATDKAPQNFADVWTLKSLIKKYSDFIAWPIKMQTAGETETETEIKDETLNSMKALWLRPPAEVTTEEYKEFYQHLTHDWNEPLKHVHYRAEGSMEFTGLFYIPSKKPWNYQTKDYEFGLNLYIKRVFIMENCKELMPPWLRFVKGMVDSSDLSLNVSREILQQDRQVIMMRKNLVNKVLSTLKDLLGKDRTQFEQFFNEFGTTLKEGVPMEPTLKEKISDILLFKSSFSDKFTTLEEYIGRMKEGQKEIYFITGERLEAVKNSPYLEKLQEKGLEVIFLTDPVDEWLTQELREYKTKPLRSITKEGLDLDSEEEKKQKAEEKISLEERFKPLVENMKTWLNADVKDVVFSDRLTKTAVCLVGEDQGMSAHMEKLLSQMGESAPKTKRILEINAKHPLFSVMASANEEQQKSWAEILFNQALLTEGSPLPDPVRFSNLIADLMISDRTTHN